MLLSCCLSRSISREIHPEQSHQTSVMSFDYTCVINTDSISLFCFPHHNNYSPSQISSTRQPHKGHNEESFQEIRVNLSNWSKFHYKKQRRGDSLGGWKCPGLLWTPAWGISRNRDRLAGACGVRPQSAIPVIATSNPLRCMLIPKDQSRS